MTLYKATSEGNVPMTTEEEVEFEASRIPSPPSIPVVVTMRQARLALLHNNLLQQVTEAVAVMEGMEGEAARIEWEFSQYVYRDWPLVIALSASLSLTSQQLDTLFVYAKTL